MGSFIEINDTLQLTAEQGFPKELNLETHLKTPYSLNDFKDTVFEFHDKPDIRLYKTPPVRNFFVENRNGKWIYWGLVLILEIKHDYIKRTTSGRYKIIRLNSPQDMKEAFQLIDTRPELDYFNGSL